MKSYLTVFSKQNAALFLSMTVAACSDSGTNNQYGQSGGFDGLDIPKIEECHFYDQSEFGSYIERGDFSCVKKALDEGVDPNGKYTAFFNTKESPALVLAMGSRSLDKLDFFDKDMTIILKMLFAKGASINQRFDDGETPLTFAMNLEKKYKPIARYLMKHSKINVNLPGRQYPLEMAVSHDDSDLALKLLDQGADSSLTKTDESLLRVAISRDLDQVAQKMIAKGARVEINGDQGLALFKLSISRDKKWLFEDLIAKKVPLNESGDDGYTPLMISLSQADRSYFKALLGKLSVEDINFKNKDGKPALVLAVQSDAVQDALELIDKGSNVDYRNGLQETLLHFVSKMSVGGTSVLLGKLIDKGLSVDAVDASGISPIANAVRSSNLNSVMKLVARGAKLNFVFPSGDTLLHQAVMNNDYHMVEFLLGSIEADSRGEKGKTSLMLARSIEIARILLDHGASLNLADQDGLHLISNLVLGLDDSVKLNFFQFMTERGVDLNADLSKKVNPLCSVLSLKSYESDPVEDEFLNFIKLMVLKKVNLHAKDGMGYSPIHYVNDVRVLKFLLSVSPEMKNDRTSYWYMTLEDLLEKRKKSYRAKIDDAKENEEAKKWYASQIRHVDELLKILQ